MIRLFLISILSSVLISGFAQTAGDTARYVINSGGGTSSGGTYTTYYSIGDPAASDELAVGATIGADTVVQTVYPGFIPGNLILLSFGLKKDSAVLVVLYESAKGSGWVNNDGWLSDPNLANWHGVEITNLRVSALNLPGNNLQNNFPEVVKNLEKLHTLDVSDNNLKKFPNLSTLPGLTTLAVEKNDLSFNDIAPNVGTVETFTYSPQDPYGTVRADTIQAGNSKTYLSTIPGATTYQWQFDEFSTDTVLYSDLAGQTSSSITVSNLDYAKMGTYKVVATSPEKVPGLTIESSRKYLFASTEVSGAVNVGGMPLTTGSEIGLFRITEDGAYDSAAFGNTEVNGTYQLGKVVLGNFVLKVDPTEDYEGENQLIQTYYISQDDWQLADVLEVLNQKGDINIDLLFVGPPAQQGSAQIYGYIESELDDPFVIEDEGRTTARRKVRKAACSMRRFKSQGRPDQQAETEIAYYIETDDEGYFSFDGVEDGTYLINIQFPGVPMNNQSGVEFTIGGDKENQVFEVNALITELGIEVEQTEILFNWKPYIKDVVLYPNPSSEYLDINYTVYRDIDDLKIQLLALDGRKLLEIDEDHLKGRKHTRIDMSTFSTGSYLLSFTDEDGTFKETRKVARQ
ncbi:T9SS type A sorting domain-containing protein [Marinoscillum sp. MHG1-6]|uniref:T9SS type A sorting domain-containing protein n=1 Tax=Marinoscillum sp. MHG1-6 TaxID=2959627 RepID=UPI002156F722|nr:T9SS type A sorting domain-containing protein [Marinoscillum sp. MHG1-6]